MTIYERQNIILNFLRQHHSTTIKELSKIVWTSESSIRRDIKALESKGYLKQFYGGVVLSGYENSVVPIAVRNNYNSSAKDELAKQAATRFFDGATVFMDGSSTVRRIIKYINSFRNIKIITNNLLIFNETISREIQFYCTGGRFVPENNTFVGSSAENFLKGINADLMFFSSQAISETGEISDASEEETSVRKVMLSQAKKKIFLCDSSKLGLKYTFTVCNKDDIDEIICDKKLPWE